MITRRALVDPLARQPLKTSTNILRAASIIPRCTFGSTASSAAADKTSSTWKLAKVPHRGVVQVSGRDTVKLLQGLVSNDVKALDSTTLTHQPPNMVYAGFMNPQGRMLADVFIHRQPANQDGSPRWLLDIDSRTLPSLVAFIKKFKLRSKVKLTDLSTDYHVVQAWDSNSQAPPTIAEKLSIDPRSPSIGYRGVLSAAEILDVAAAASTVDGLEYTLHRITNGVAEGALDFPQASSLPLENNLDYMHGVDFRKGCYVGQELTARTHHTGVVRKRIVSLSFYLAGTPPPASIHDVDPAFPHQLPTHLAEIRSKPISTASEAATKPARGKAAGKFTSGVYNVGLACLRLEQVRRWADSSSADPNSKHDALEFSVLSADGETTLLARPWIPSWWPHDQPVPSDQDT